MPQETIQGRIIRIINPRTVIINLGEKDGITSSSIFNILGEAEEIIDPFTEESLGEVVIVKSKVKAVQIYERFTIATTQWNIVKSTLFSSLLTSTVKPFVESEQIDHGELRVLEAEVRPWKALTVSPVRVGDYVEVLVNKTPQNAEANLLTPIELEASLEESAKEKNQNTTESISQTDGD